MNLAFLNKQIKILWIVFKIKLISILKSDRTQEVKNIEYFIK